MRLRHPKPVLSHSRSSDVADLSLGSRVTRWVYFAVLVALFSYIVWYGVFRFFYIDNRGLVEVDRTRVASSRGGRILELPVKGGDHVNKGDLLVRLKSPNNCTGDSSLSGTQTETPELRTLRRKQMSDRTRLKSLRQQRNEKKTQLHRMKYRRAMELSIGSSVSRQKLEDEMLRLDGEVRSLSAIIPLRKKDILHLEQVLKQGVERPGCEDELIYAPFAGIIVSKNHLQFEVMQRTEAIMAIVADDAKAHIESFFRNDDSKTLSVGMELTVLFPDGRESRAKVMGIKSTALLFPNRKFQNNYLPSRTRILTILEPVADEDIPLWKQFNQMEVVVRGWR